MDQIAKRLLDRDVFLDGNGHPENFRFRDPPFRLAIAARDIFKNFAACRNHSWQEIIPEGIERRLELHLEAVSAPAHRHDHGVSQLVGVIVHNIRSPGVAA